MRLTNFTDWRMVSPCFIINLNMTDVIKTEKTFLIYPVEAIMIFVSDL